VDKTALVTGGSGALGSAIVRKFRAGNIPVVFSFRTNGDAAAALAEETGALAVQAELTDGAQVCRLVAGAIERLGTIDILVNNAGQTQIMPFALMEEEDWDSTIAANLKSMYLVTRQVVRHMVGKRSGVIVNIGSLAGHRLLDVPVHYATAKAGVSGFTLALAQELARYNIRVNSVVPGLIEDGVGRMVPEKERAEYERYCTAGRLGRVDEVAEAVAFLASDAASYINAQNLFVDGGL
jgi:3-oxoacyl-[acyl-carrier protein] reductase